MIVTVTPIYAALAALLLLLLSVRVVTMRHKLRAALGDKGDTMLERRIRVHGNFVEYAPITLLLLLLVELQGGPVWLLHAIGVSLLAGRCIHAYGVSQAQENFKIRTTGMTLTFLALLAGAAANLVLTVL
ncbi:MAPEG family protein [Aestuariispira ectoiniformans]|uniref:MAPEG family protein n=1 Tax=Aestuariispira ectoiniformans TaxID=2775080 RepID=UPI00223C2FB9|nr:MAPEG family protein [Aestuariispira ectoiniformans]